MLKAIDNIFPGVVDGSASQGRVTLALWGVAALGVVFLVVLIFGAIIAARERRRRNGLPVKKSIVLSAIRRFLGWLFYPSFQRFFTDPDAW